MIVRQHRKDYIQASDVAKNPLHVLQTRWAGCTKCDLSNHRHRIVHVRGRLPCEVLFIGEAPGESENIIGYPFVGDAGKLLDELLCEVSLLREFEAAIINLVACYPGKDDNGNFNRPHKVALKQCEPRLRHLFEIANPHLVVTLGETAEKKLPKDLLVSHKSCHLCHPSSILRLKNQNDARLARKRFTLTLSEAIREHLS
jgi:DNA polymerase